MYLPFVKHIVFFLIFGHLLNLFLKTMSIKDYVFIKQKGWILIWQTKIKNAITIIL